MKDFSFLKLFIRIGPAIAVLVALGFTLASGWAFAGLGWGWPVVLIGVAVGVLAGFLILVLVDLVKVIVDMLLPH